MENLFNRLTIKAARAERVKIIRKNLLETYHVYLALKEIDTIDQLLDICRALEEVGIIKTHDQKGSGTRNVFSLEPDLLQLPTRKFQKRNDSSDRSRMSAELRCYKCKQLGHIKRNCQVGSFNVENRNKRGPRCFGCGKEGVIKPNCSKCSKNL